MLFSVYVLGGCYIWITILVQNGVQTHECGQRWNDQTPADRYEMKKTPSPRNSWPFHVGLYSSALGPYPFCGGTLIASKWVLTAAHCIVGALQCKFAPYGELFSYAAVTGHYMIVYVADHKFTPRQRPSYNVKVNGVIMHPSFNGNFSAGGYDVALLKLNREVKRARYAEYACLPEAGLYLPTGQFCYLAGWGSIPNPSNPSSRHDTDTLMEIRVPIAPTADCKIMAGFSNDGESFCTDNSYGASCDGDSGGGLHCLSQDGSKWFVYGVLSNGPDECLEGFDVFAFTVTKLSWIEYVIRTNP